VSDKCETCAELQTMPMGNRPTLFKCWDCGTEWIWEPETQHWKREWKVWITKPDDGVS
jgi:predicted RNA-binding Zn-ribbon protein involved in translation (DUF1610 family)